MAKQQEKCFFGTAIHSRGSLVKRLTQNSARYGVYCLVCLMPGINAHQPYQGTPGLGLQSP